MLDSSITAMTTSPLTVDRCWQLQPRLNTSAKSLALRTCETPSFTTIISSCSGHLPFVSTSVAKPWHADLTVPVSAAEDVSTFAGFSETSQTMASHGGLAVWSDSIVISTLWFLSTRKNSYQQQLHMYTEKQKHTRTKQTKVMLWLQICQRWFHNFSTTKPSINIYTVYQL